MWAILKRTVKAFQDDDLTDWAAALTYYGIMSLFPMLIALVFVVGLVTALWSASGYVGAFIRASNAIYEVEEGRPFYKLRPFQLLVTLVMVVLLALVAIGLVITGPLTDAVGNLMGLGHTATTIFSIAK